MGKHERVTLGGIPLKEANTKDSPIGAQINADHNQMRQEDLGLK